MLENVVKVEQISMRNNYDLPENQKKVFKQNEAHQKVVA